MSRRVLTVSKLTFQEKWKKNPQTYAPSDLEGVDLMDIFEEWARKLSTSQIRNPKRQTWVSVAEVTRHAPRVILLDLRVGSYGEPGEIVDTSTGNSITVIEGHEAPTGQNRALLFVPERGERAYFLAEASSRGSAGGPVLHEFADHFRSYTNQIIMDHQRVFEDDVWQKGARLMEVEARVTSKSRDLADGLDVQVRRISHSAKPARGKSFPPGLLGKLTNTSNVAKVVGVDDLPADHQVFVTMARDGRQKKFALEEAGAPAIRQVLNDSDQSPLSTAELVEVCSERVSELEFRLGGQWDSTWSRGTREKG